MLRSSRSARRDQDAGRSLVSSVAAHKSRLVPGPAALCGGGLGAALAILAPSVALADPPRPYWHPGPPWAPLAPATPEMHEISNLFWGMLAISALVFLFVTIFLVLSVVRYTAKPGQEGEPKQVFGNRAVEITWTLIPTFILLVAFIFTVNAIRDINSPKQGKILDIYAIGHQWWWQFDYHSLRVTTADELHVPVHVPIHFHVTSNDVIHSFWSPQLERQIDANPTIDNAVYVEYDTPGVYSGTCYEYCGTEHAFMKYRVVVQSAAQFKAWVAHEHRSPLAGSYQSKSGVKASALNTALIAAGEKVFTRNTCVDCHTISGVSGGAVGPNLTHLGSRWTIGAGAAPMSEQVLEKWIYDPATYKPGIIMPAYTFLSNRDLHALATYLINLK